MKKLFAILVSGTLLLSLAACGGSAGAGRGEATPESTAAPEETGAEDVDALAGTGSTFGATIEPTVVVDEQGVKITANELRCTDYDAELALVIENNSDKDLSFHSGTLGYSRNSVNGYMVEGLYVGTDVPAGKKANETVNIDLEELQIYGITDIADIELAFDINDSDYNDYLRTEPTQIKTSLAESYDYTVDTYRDAMRSGDAIEAFGGDLVYFSDEEVYSEQGVCVISQAFVNNDSEEPAILVELENTADQMVTVRVGDIALNGLLVQSGPWSSDDINAGKRRVITLQPGDMLDPAYWETFGLDTVGEVSFTLGLEDADGNALCDKTPLTLTIPDAETAFNRDGNLVYSEGGVRILNMGIVPDAAGASFGTHLFLLAENVTEKQVQFDVAYDSLSVNGYMTDFFCIGPMLAPGQSGVMDVELDTDSLEENGIEAPEDIKTIELMFELHDERYNDLATPKVTIGEGSQPVQDAAVNKGDGSVAGAGDSSSSTGNGGGTDIPGVSPDFKETMDSYEAFFDEYAAFMESCQNDSSSVNMMDYLSFLTKYAEVMQKLDEIDTDSLSDADMAYYTQTMLRISSKMVGMAG